MLWWRHGEGLIGLGEALRLEFSGPERFKQASAAWAKLTERALVTDEVKLPGTGLVALGTFAFADDSADTSVLIVPEIIIGRREGRTWVTYVGVDGPAKVTSLPELEPFGNEFRIHLHAGEQSEEGYAKSVSKALSKIEAGEIEKVVLARDLAGRMPAEGDLRGVLSTLALSYADCWTFAINGLLGASPETLVKVLSGRLFSRVLAGSIARGRTALADRDASISLASSQKELLEHEFAVKSVLDVLTPHASEIAANEIPFALKLPNLWHLASDIDGFLKDGVNSIDLAGELHPTAAVAGLPKSDAIELISELEPFDRGYFSGPVGWIDGNGDGEWAVALRCARVLPGGDIHAWAGCGIVAGSTPEHELAETKLKFRPIREAFA